MIKKKYNKPQSMKIFNNFNLTFNIYKNSLAVYVEYLINPAKYNA